MCHILREGGHASVSENSQLSLLISGEGSSQIMATSTRTEIPMVFYNESLPRKTTPENIPSLQKILANTSNNINPICLHLFPSYILINYHHKTGFALSKQFVKGIFVDFCRILSSVPKPDRGFYMRRGWPSYNFEHLKFLDVSNSPKEREFVYFHFIRSPIDTILSGFDYHVNCPEKWTKRPFLGGWIGEYIFYVRRGQLFALYNFA